jgi:cytochrome o ubiquinol oxidase subunit IV
VSGDRAAYRRELRSYIWGLVLALVLTAVPFALVHWHVLAASSLLFAIGLFALVQAMVHFRFFLHIDPPHRNVDAMLLLLFSAVILVMMVGGTVWVLGNLHSRMY